MKRAVFAVALVLAVTVGALPRAWSEEQPKYDDKKINALADLLGRELDRKNENACGGSIFFQPTMIVCTSTPQSRYWLIQAKSLKSDDVEYIAVGSSGYFVYLPKVDGSENMEDLKAKGALYSDDEIHLANSLVDQRRGREAIRKLKENIDHLKQQESEDSSSHNSSAIREFGVRGFEGSRGGFN